MKEDASPVPVVRIAQPAFSWRSAVSWGGVTVLALVLRLNLLSYQTSDYLIIRDWLRFLLNNGGLLAMPHTTSNYPPLYLYLLWLSGDVFSRLGLAEIFQVKIIAILFDLVGALYMARLVRLRYPHSALPCYAYTVTLFAPTVVINSAMWSQVDMMYTSMLLACLYYLLCDRPVPALLAFGIAFSFKPLALFVGPLLLVLFLRRRLAWRSFLLIPVVYMVSILPVVLVGGGLWRWLDLYGPQAVGGTRLQYNAPTIYAWVGSIQNDATGYLFGAGRLFCLGVILALVYAAANSPARLTGERILLLAVLFAILGPYTVPGMRDRYFFAADVISIALAFYLPRLFYVPIGMMLISLFAGFPFLLHYRPIPMHILAAALLALLLLVAWQAGRELQLVPEREENDD